MEDKRQKAIDMIMKSAEAQQAGSVKIAGEKIYFEWFHDGIMTDQNDPDVYTSQFDGISNDDLIEFSKNLI